MNKRTVISLGLVLSVIISTIVSAGGFYNYCPYCGGPIGNCYCSNYSYNYANNGNCNNDYYQEDTVYYDYDYGCDYGYDYVEEGNNYNCNYEGYYEEDYGCDYGYDYVEEGNNYDCSYGYNYNTDCSGLQMMHWANLRDCYGNIIGTVYEGSYISIIGPDYNDASRTIIYDYATGLQGSVSTVYIYGGSCYEYENPTEYGGGCGYYEGSYEGSYYEGSYENCGYYEGSYEGNGYCEGSYEGYYEGSYEGSGYCECSYGYTEYDPYNESYGAGYYEGIWVDVDINAQTVNIYNGNTIVLSSACVTGLPGIAETPCGQYYILDRQRGSVLSGVDPNGVAYARAVDYWMPFTESGCGFHDATWRDSFGGDIYENYGSYGCVNCEYDFVSQMYDMVDTGCLVNIH